MLVRHGHIAGRARNGPHVGHYGQQLGVDLAEVAQQFGDVFLGVLGQLAGDLLDVRADGLGHARRFGGDHVDIVGRLVNLGQ